MTNTSIQRAALYRMIWRWHFYAAVFVLPLMVLLSISGALYLFKPQIDRWEERAYQGLPTAGAVPASAQLDAAKAAVPGGKWTSYRLPQVDGDAAVVHFKLPQGGATDVFVSPQGKVLGQIAPEGRIIAIDRKIHGQLLLGRNGSWLVELAASWAIVMIVTGLYLWWPKNGAAWGAGVVWPRVHLGGRAFWRDMHAVTGFWVSGLALVLLFTGLPWASAWGSAFKAVRQEMGWVKGPQDWTIGGKVADDGGDEHAGHNSSAAKPDAMAAMPGMEGMAGMDMAGMHHHHAGGMGAGFNTALFDVMVDHAKAEHLAFPALVIPPGAPAGEGGAGKPAKGWVVKSDAQNRPLRVTLRYDGQTGELKAREDITNRQPIDKVMAYGIAWHEGQLFGIINQFIGVLTALMLVTLAVSGFVMWRRRKPEGTLGAPPQFSQKGKLRGIGAWGLLVFLAVWLPMFTGSLVFLLLLDRLVLPHLPGLARWFGTESRGRAQRAP